MTMHSYNRGLTWFEAKDIARAGGALGLSNPTRGTVPDTSLITEFLRAIKSNKMGKEFLNLKVPFYLHSCPG